MGTICSTLCSCSFSWLMWPKSRLHFCLRGQALLNTERQQRAGRQHNRSRLLYVAVIKTMTKSDMGMKGFILFIGEGPPLRGNSKRNHDGIMLIGLILGLLRYLSHTAQAHLARDDTSHSGRGLPTSISNWCLTDMPTAPNELMVAIPQLRFPFPGWVNLITKGSCHPPNAVING